MKSAMIRNKMSLLGVMQNDGELILEFCTGVRGGGWWWLKKDGERTNVHASAAQALVRSGDIKRISSSWRDSQYKLTGQS